MNDAIKKHKKRQFKGHLWFSDFYERREKSWFTNKPEMPVEFNDDTIKLLEALKRLTKGAKNDKS